MRSGAYFFDAQVTDVTGQAVVLAGEYDVLVRGAGSAQTGQLSRRVRGEIEVHGTARVAPPAILPLGAIEPFRPDHEVSTAALMTIGRPSLYDTWISKTPNAEPAYLCFNVNHWFDVFGEHLAEVRLMGDRASEMADARLQPGVSLRAYPILVVVADGAGDVATGSEFWKAQIATGSAFNSERLRCGLQRSVDIAIKREGDLGVPERTTPSFQQTIDKALVLCRRRNDP